MAHKFTNFTRGSQLIGHFGFMFAAGVRLPLILTAITFSGMIWWRLSVLLSDHQAYLCWMRGYAWFYNWLELDPAKRINLELASGRHLLTPLRTLPDHPLVATAWARFMTAVEQGSAIAALVSVPAIIGFAWIAARFGRRAKEGRHERGAELSTRYELLAELADHNADKRAIEYRQRLGKAWRLTSPDERRAAGLYEPYRIAGVPYPWRQEQSHTMLIGTTGMGKTVVMRDLLAQARQRNQRAVVFDLTGAFIEAFYDPDRDIILNPTDARCPQWSIFDDCPDEATLTSAAEALVPQEGGSADGFWVLAARTLFIEMCLKLHDKGQATNAALSSELMTASLAHIHSIVAGTVAGPLTSPDAPRMAQSIHSILTTNGKALMALPTSGPQFSIRDWIGGAGKPGSFLFVSSRYADMAITSHLLTLWMDIAMMALMSGKSTTDLKTWFLFDELGALHRMPALEKGLQTARNFGGAIVAGVHANAKLKDTYGDNMATTIASLTKTKLILGTADRDSATWCSDFIGHRQYREMEEGYSYSANNNRDGVSLTPRRYNDPLVLPDQLMRLPQLRGYIRFPGSFPTAPVELTYVAYPSVAEPYLKRDIGAWRKLAPSSTDGPPPAPGSGSAPLADDQGRGPAAGDLTRAPPPPLAIPIGTFLQAQPPLSQPVPQSELPLSLPTPPVLPDPAGAGPREQIARSVDPGSATSASPSTATAPPVGAPAQPLLAAQTRTAIAARERDHDAVVELKTGGDAGIRRVVEGPDLER